MVFHGLPEVFRRIVGCAVEADALFNWVPIGENPGWYGWGCAPAVQRMLPLLLHGQKSLGITGRHRFLRIGQSLLQLRPRVRDERFQRTLIQHGNYTALDPTPQQLFAQLSAGSVVKAASSRPAPGLRFDVGEKLSQRTELDEP